METYKRMHWWPCESTLLEQIKLFRQNIVAQSINGKYALSLYDAECSDC